MIKAYLYIYKGKELLIQIKIGVFRTAESARQAAEKMTVYGKIARAELALFKNGNRI